MTAIARTTVIAAALGLVFLAAPAAASPPQPEGSVSQHAPAPTPEPSHHSELFPILTAGATGAIVVALVQRRSKRNRAERDRGGLIELTAGDR